MKRSPLAILSVIVGILFVILAVTYWTVPAGSLPSYVPGYVAGSADIHLKHGIASLLLGLVLFAYAWFKSAKKSIP